MAEKPLKLKSKLKRKKSSVEDLQPDFSPRGTQRKSPLVPGDRTAEPGRSVVPAAAWWNKEQLPAVEALWALTLKSAQLYLQDQNWDLIPDLPEPSTARPSALKEDDQRWCDLNEDVAPFPEPSLRTSSSPGPLRLTPSQQDLPVQTLPELSSHSRKSLNVRTSVQTSTKRTSSVGGEEERKGGERGRQRPLIPDSPVEEEEGEYEEELMEVKEAGEEGGPGGGGRLQSCPMCLLAFPAGFTQMDCDGHLAQCLSEVNVDVTW
ncbi:Fanconi anemia core complex-associated protein 20 isoform X2 [Labrus mixtus]|uniref:Fanconi anemia core complex-associated protein 20 isoform X2 n=1 Tax=Labrus mixtus TaxID=508554 RepID=UPI0029BFC61B|nr:Fanconi anemia core complex-associated protein 20 isoform X2 [Labrus mixtus]